MQLGGDLLPVFDMALGHGAAEAQPGSVFFNEDYVTLYMICTAALMFFLCFLLRLVRDGWIYLGRRTAPAG